MQENVPVTVVFEPTINEAPIIPDYYSRTYLQHTGIYDLLSLPVFIYLHLDVCAI